MEAVIEKLRGDLWKYVQGTTESLILAEILMGILILQYTFRMEPISILEIITSVVSGLYLADLGTGLVHMIADIIGRNTLDIPYHHVNPKNYFDISDIELLCQTSVAPIPLICILYNLTPLTSKSQILFQIVSLYGMHIGQITHKFAHITNTLTEEDRQKHKAMIFLQNIHLILHPNNHHPHHTSPKYDTNFCILNGWANPLLNSIVHIPFIHSRLFPDTA